jgi:predicted Zn finger-like uncharacterized protein
VKFLCEHCKAKYQIADEKVAGRTVRMKCRKCGNQIEVRAAVTETSVNTRLPQESAKETGAPPAAGGHPPARGQHPAAPRTAGHGGGFGGASRPPAGRQVGGGPATASPRSQDGGALAGAFQRSVQKDQKEEEVSVALDLRELSAADEWYAAINGVPVGPVRVAELRRKAALGVVTEDSLVWQEGMAEWRPVRAVTELAAVVREAAAGGRVSLLTPPPPEGRTSAPPPPPRGASTRPASPPTRGPSPPQQRPGPLYSPAPPAARSNVVPITSRLATAERLDEASFEPDAGPLVSPDPFALKGPQAPAVNPFATTAQAIGPQGTGQGPLPFVAVPVVAPDRQRTGPPWPIFITMLVLATAFGVTAAIIFVSRPAAVTTAPSAAVPAPGAAGLTAPASTTTAETQPQIALTDTSAGTTLPEGGSGRSGAVASRAQSPGSRAPTPGTVTDPSLQDLIKHSGVGPGGGGDPGAGGGGGGSPLTESQLMTVVRQHQPGINRTCWERGSAANTAATVNVSATITLAPSGQVQSVQATGNDPVMVHCIENAVRGWQFPPAGGQTFIAPFHFVRQ